MSVLAKDQTTISKTPEQLQHGKQPTTSVKLEYLKVNNMACNMFLPNLSESLHQNCLRFDMV